MLRLARSWVPQKLSSGAFSNFCICGPNPAGDSQSYGSALAAVEPVRRTVPDEAQQPLRGTVQSHQHCQHLSPPPSCPRLLLRPCAPAVGLSLWASVPLEGPWLWPTLFPTTARPRSCPRPSPSPAGCCRAAPWPRWPCSPSCQSSPAGADLLLLGHVPLPREGCRVMGIHTPCLECTCSSSMKLNFTLASFPLLFFPSENQTQFLILYVRGFLKYHFWVVYPCLPLEQTLSDGGYAPNFVNISKWCIRVSHRVVISVSRKRKPSENRLVRNLALRCWQ